MSNKFNKLLYLLFIFFILSYSSSGQVIHDLIQPLNLSAGVSDTVLISDLFYARNYKNLKLSKNPDVKVKFNTDKTKFIFKPSANFEGISLVGFNFKAE